MKRLPLLLLASSTLLLAGCPKQPTTPPAGNTEAAVPAQEAPAATVQQPAAEATAADATPLTPAQPLPDPEAELLGRTVLYFDFDSEALREEYAPVVAAHARKLAAGNLRIRLEGHTDERGSDSYNNALGLRRAEAVKKALRLAGAGDGQIDAVTFGEQKPAAGGEGEGEEAWARNRRVEIVYPAP